MNAIVKGALKVGAHVAFPLAVTIAYHNGWLSWFPGLGGPKVR